MAKYTIAGTDIDLVKKKNQQSGMSYNEAKAFIAATTGGHGTRRYSNTDPGLIKEKLKH
ncbi:gamma-type small acid-soluble spore protein [Sediminibacillus massiliensis]|uniref:gamma-type small acid-soluble spore protein n=1 Tax=Sediminibacillus massiliensis TaxID=1926277 RepID=UPI0015C31ABC|nr:gamma-type small acid-soluble spore protein [Sediminibacillus massiliensis]